MAIQPYIPRGYQMTTPHFTPRKKGKSLLGKVSDVLGVYNQLPESWRDAAGNLFREKPVDELDALEKEVAGFSDAPDTTISDYTKKIANDNTLIDETEHDMTELENTIADLNDDPDMDNNSDIIDSILYRSKLRGLTGPV